MMTKDFWHNAKIAVMGAGSWGTMLAHIVAEHCREVRLWTRSEEHAAAINSTKTNAKYLGEFRLRENITALSDIGRVHERGLDVVIWALPSHVCREQMRAAATFYSGSELVLHATKGIEDGTLHRISQIIREELPLARIGVISGPNLAHEVARGDPAGTVVASAFDEVLEAGCELLTGDRLRVYSSHDVIGVEWAGSLKNILAIAAGAADSLKLGWNSRSLLISRGLVEMVRFGLAQGAEESTFLGLAGLGDLLATSSSPLSRNYRVGLKVIAGEKLETVLKSVGGVAEGVRTAGIVRRYAEKHSIPMPITTVVDQFLQGELDARGAIQALMSRPGGRDYHSKNGFTF